MISGEKPYACKLEGCDKAFAQMANLQHHMRMHNKDGTKPHDPSEKPYKCDECFQEFHTQRGVNCHKQKVLQYLFLTLYKDFSSNFPQKQVLTKLFFFIAFYLCIHAYFETPTFFSFSLLSLSDFRLTLFTCMALQR